MFKFIFNLPASSLQVPISDLVASHTLSSSKSLWALVGERVVPGEAGGELLRGSGNFIAL